MHRQRLPEIASLNLGFGRLRVVIEQRLGRDDEARCAIAALDRAAVGECFVQRMGVLDRTQPGRGENTAAVGLADQHKTAIDRHAVDQHRVRAAVALLAAALDVHVAEIASVWSRVTFGASATMCVRPLM